MVLSTMSWLKVRLMFIHVAPARGFKGMWLTSDPQLALVGYIHYARFGGLEFGLYSAGHHRSSFI